ncbi:hypothetical protein AVEN_165232-1 [Araneus ventricosus]|uniref:Uncharacterized protein n=1 Tax=Araneus ventricosus TaxID=182803 RepID=A0A4Y2B990_ARAVE|nr:hypothetical protein AVEN_165232-1 [Araneus ventricosus]
MRWNSWLGLKTTGSVSMNLVFSIAASVNTCTFLFKVTSANLFPTIHLTAFSPSSSAESQLTLSTATIPEDREMSSSDWLKGECCFSQIKNFFKSLVSATISIKKCIGRKIHPSLQRKPPLFRHLKTSRHGVNPKRYDAIRHISALGQATANFHRSHLTCSIVMPVQTPH